MRYLTEDIISSIQLSGFIPVSDNTFSTSDFIFLMNEEFQNKIVPHIMSIRENYFLTSKYVSVTGNLPRYSIPERAIGNALKDVMWVPLAGDLQNAYPIPKGDPHTTAGWSGSAGSPSVFHMEGDEIVLVPTPTSSGSYILFYYYRRPSQIVATTSCSKITAVSTVSGNTTFTVNTDLTGSLSVGSLVDINSAKSPFFSWADDVAITGITASTIIVSATDIDNAVGTVLPVVGDYIAAAGTTNIPQIPQEFHVILAEMVTARCLKSLGAVQNYSVVQANIKDLLAASFKLIANRVEDEVDVVFERNSILNAIQGSGYSSASRWG